MIGVVITFDDVENKAWITVSETDLQRYIGHEASFPRLRISRERSSVWKTISSSSSLTSNRWVSAKGAKSQSLNEALPSQCKRYLSRQPVRGIYNSECVPTMC
jgi:hypothetical protein